MPREPISRLALIDQRKSLSHWHHGRVSWGREKIAVHLTNLSSIAFLGKYLVFLLTLQAQEEGLERLHEKAKTDSETFLRDVRCR